ncbi:MAG: Fe-S-containing hydro-lyase [Clostridiaceae bacterium]|jgi:fumarate hydratase subunit beta|nr:Fe-S-containing hydro-lyase [Clostridiaceae bacterium]
MSKKHIILPLTDEIIKELKAGDEVLLSGILYTGRDAAHERMAAILEKGEAMPFDIVGQTIYYAGPCPAPEGRIIGSAGPTTSGRMDSYTPVLIENGLKGMIGKGLRDESVIDAIKKHGAIYFGAIGGAAALISSCIIKQEIIAFEDLGTEAIRKIEVKDFPCFVIIDSFGNDRYKEGRKEYEIKG